MAFMHGSCFMKVCHSSTALAGMGAFFFLVAALQACYLRCAWPLQYWAAAQETPSAPAQNAVLRLQKWGESCEISCLCPKKADFHSSLCAAALTVYHCAAALALGSPRCSAQRTWKIWRTSALRRIQKPNASALRDAAFCCSTQCSACPSLSSCRDHSMQMSHEPTLMLRVVWRCGVKIAPPVHLWLIENKDEGLMTVLELGRKNSGLRNDLRCGRFCALLAWCANWICLIPIALWSNWFA